MNVNKALACRIWRRMDVGAALPKGCFRESREKIIQNSATPCLTGSKREERFAQFDFYFAT